MLGVALLRRRARAEWARDMRGEARQDCTSRLRAYRKAFYACPTRRANALFELTGAILTVGTVPSTRPT